MATKRKNQVELNAFEKIMNALMDANHGRQLLTGMSLGKTRIGVDCKSGASPVDYLSDYGIRIYGLLTYRKVAPGGKSKRNLRAFYVRNGQRKYALDILKKKPSDFGIVATVGGSKLQSAMNAVERVVKIAGGK